MFINLFALPNPLNQSFFAELSVSAIIPAYNSEKTIIKSLDSVLEQTTAVYEVIVVDDGSTDDTVKLICEYIDRHNSFNIKLFQQSNSGPSAARNYGIKHAQGNLIAFLDSDDQWLPGKTEEQLKLFRAYGKDLGLTSCLTSHSKKKNIDKDLITIRFEDLLWRNLFSTPTVMIWKELLTECSFDTSQKYSEDYNLWLRIALRRNVVLINKILVKLDDKPVFGHTGLSSQLWEMEKGELSNYFMLYNNTNINRYQYCFFSAYSLIKFIIRCVVSYKRRVFSFTKST